jgi:hypothetical protein
MKHMTQINMKEFLRKTEEIIGPICFGSRDKYEIVVSENRRDKYEIVVSEK